MNRNDYPPPLPQQGYYPPAYEAKPPRTRKAPMDKSAVIGIVITSICFAMLFMALFTPWLTVREADYPEPEECPKCGGDNIRDRDDGEYECNEAEYTGYPYYEYDICGYTWQVGKDYEWTSYDYSGEGYGKDADDEMEEFYRIYDSMDNGKIQGFFGIILGLVFGIAFIVIGNIHLIGELPRRIMLFFRGVTGIAMLLPATLLMVCGSKFIGISISGSTSGNSENETIVLSIAPFILFIVGIILFILSFAIISHSFKRFSRIKRSSDKPRDNRTLGFNVNFKKYATILVILAMLAIVTLPLLPIVSGSYKFEFGDEKTEYSVFETSGQLLNEQTMNDQDYANYLGWVNFAFWFIFPLALIALFGVLFLASGLNDLTGYILGLVANLLAIFLVLGLIFKILFIVNVFDNESEFMISKTLWYGYNYFPLLVMIGLIVVCILYMIHTIKGSTAFFRSMPRRPRPSPMGYGAPPPRRDDYYDRRDQHYPPPRDDYYDDRRGRDHPPPRRDEQHDGREWDYPIPPY